MKFALNFSVIDKSWINCTTLDQIIKIASETVCCIQFLTIFYHFEFAEQTPTFKQHTWHNISHFYVNLSSFILTIFTFFPFSVFVTRLTCTWYTFVCELYGKKRFLSLTMDINFSTLHSHVSVPFYTENAHLFFISQSPFFPTHSIVSFSLTYPLFLLLLLNKELNSPLVSEDKLLMFTLFMFIFYFF